MSRYNKRYSKRHIPRRIKEINIKPENKDYDFNHKNQLKYKVVIKEKGCRKPKMTTHAKNTPCLDIIEDILKETSQEESRK